jgi:hypothetical protein
MKDLRTLCDEAIQLWDADCDMDAVINEMRTALAQPEPEGVGDEEIEQEAIANADTDDEYRAFKRGAFFVQERISRPTIKPEVPAPMSADTLAAIIREVDGAHRLGAAALAVAILAHPGSRWSPTIEPVPVAERLPGAEDCDAMGRCWAWGDADPRLGWKCWKLFPFRYVCAPPDVTHWLPHNALPVPGAEVAPADRGSESSLAEFNDGGMPLG